MRRIDIPAAPRVVLPVLTAVNVVVFLAWQLMAANAGEAGIAWMSDHFLVSYTHVFGGRPWVLLTSAVSHVDLYHLLFNTLALWVFGRDVEAVVGGRGFLHLYVAGGLLASVGHVFYGLVIGDPTPALGASGSVMAVAVVFASLWPRRLLLLFFILPMTARTAVLLFILFDILGLVGAGVDRIAHAAHLGGALYGWLYYRNRLGPYLSQRLQRLRDAARSRIP